MAKLSSLATELARALPDTARWIDTRGMLLAGGASIGGDPAGGNFVVRALAGARAVVSVVGYPAHEVIARAVQDATLEAPVIAQRENANHVGQALASYPPASAGTRWVPERVVLHRLGPRALAAITDGGAVRLLRDRDALDHLPPALREEISDARRTAPVAVGMADSRPVSFCYPSWLTETLWDVSIDTLEQYRRRGHAARAVHFMTAFMRRNGREPVWGGMESNVASLELARTLGFIPEDEVVVFLHRAADGESRATSSHSDGERGDA